MWLLRVKHGGHRHAVLLLGPLFLSFVASVPKLCWEVNTWRHRSLEFSTLLIMSIRLNEIYRCGQPLVSGVSCYLQIWQVSSSTLVRTHPCLAFPSRHCHASRSARSPMPQATPPPRVRQPTHHSPTHTASLPLTTMALPSVVARSTCDPNVQGESEKLASCRFPISCCDMTRVG